MSELFRRYEAKADSLREFCEKYHRPDKLTDFNRQDDYDGHKYDLEEYGYTIIPGSSSITGDIISYYGPI